MLNKIIEFSIRNKLIIGLFTSVLLIFGFYEATRLPIDAQPDITNNQVQIITVAPSFGAADIERLVTFPIEQATSNISGIVEMRSFCRFGLSLVTIVFDDDTDVYWARQQVSERLQNLKDQIPEGIGAPELGPISTGLGEIFQYVVRAKEGYENRYDATELRTIQDWMVRRQLMGTKGVAEVSSFGGKLKQYEIAIDPARLLAHGININDVFEALENNNQNTGGAYIEKEETVLFIRSAGLVGNIQDIENIAVRSTNDKNPVLIRDVAEVNTGFATRYGAMTYNDKGEVSGAIVMMLKGENANKVIKNIKERLNTIQKTLPEGVIIEPFLDRAKMVNNTISTVMTNLMEGALIVIFILVIFLGNLRAGLLVASVIPLSMLFAIIMMNLFNIGGNLMSLGALDFGLIVDGAVIIVEAVLHQLAHRKHFGLNNRITQHEMDVQVSGAASKMVNSAVFGQIIILIVYLPIFTLQGIEGKMFKPMAQTVAFALIGAFILSLTYVPMMSALLLSKKKQKKQTISDKVMYRLEDIHLKFLIKALKFKKTIIATVILLFAAAVFLVSRMGGEFIPSLEEGDFAVEMRILPGSNISKTIEVTNKAAGILLTQFPEVEKVVTKIGSAEIPTEPMPMDAGDMIVVLKPKKQWTSAKTFTELSEKMSKALEVLPGLTTGFQFPVQMRFNELMTGARQDVVCKIYGEDLDSLVHYANRLGNIINTVKGAEDLYIEPLTGAPQVIVNYNRNTLARYGLSITAANRIVNMAFAGQSTGVVYEGEKRFDLVVRLNSEKRRDIEDIKNLYIPTASGTQVQLQQLAEVKYISSPNQIQRENTQRKIVVGFNIRGRDVQSIVNELQQKEAKSMHIAGGYSITYGGSFENLNKAKARLGIAVPVSLALIFLLLFFAFNSVKQSLLIYTAIPFSAIGGVYFLVLRNMPFSISAGVGFIALFGVAVLNGIVLVAEFNRLKKHGIANTTRIVLLGTRVRLRPVLMTAFVASLGFLPMAFSTGSGAEVQRPLATVVIGGLLLATFLTLFVLPILYVLFEHPRKIKQHHKNRFKKAGATAILLLVFCSTYSQQTVTLEQAIETAINNNRQARSSELIIAYHEKLVNTAIHIAPADITAEYGRINTLERDIKLGVAQSFNLPVVYKRQKTALQEEWQAAILNKAIIRAQLKKAVTEVFCNILNQQQKKELLLRRDSLFQHFSRLAQLKLDKGETDITELTAAKIQSNQVNIELQLLQHDMELLLLQLQLLMNTPQPLIPEASSAKLKVTGFNIITDIAQHPEIQWLQQQVKINEAQTQVEKSKLLPAVSAGFFSQSMKDINNKTFNTVQLGVALPLFNNRQKQLVEAARIKTQLAENEMMKGNAQLTTKYRQLLSSYRNYSNRVQFYETQQLPQATILLQSAMEQYQAGNISYMEWILLTQPPLQIESDYIEAIVNLNTTIIELNYITAK